ncbi:MAG: peptidoglycan-binding protein [Clostridiales bacterium]|nr:peptidoglycan-binding protein [Clostridiales bacterium]
MRLKKTLAMMVAIILLTGTMGTALAATQCMRHDWSIIDWITGDSPCGTQQGVHYCHTCGEQELVTKYVEHRWTDWMWENEPTCQQEGIRSRYCMTCGHNEEERTGYGAHKFGEWKTVSWPTCTKEGRQERTCSVCGQVESSSIPKKNHNFGEWIIVQDATPFSVGIRERTCSVCGYTQREEFYPDRTLIRGGNNDKDAVKELQEKLNEEGYDCGKADGVFGEQTEQAVKEFQEDHGMDPDGVAWPGMQEELFGEENEPNEPSPTEAPNFPPLFNPPPTSNENPEDAVIEGGLDIFKAAFTPPANGVYYVAGETITFEITIHNNSNSAMYNVNVYDTMIADETPIKIYEKIIPGFAETLMVNYTVTEIDTMCPTLFNVAQVMGTADDGKDYAAMCTLEVLVGYDSEYPPVFGVITDVQVVKEEISTPENGKYYTEGETISYKITVFNNGETMLENVCVYDSLKTDGKGRIAIIDSMGPGEAHENFFDYVVTAEDVATGFVENMASAGFDIVNIECGNIDVISDFADSNIVISDTDGDEEEIVPDFAGKIDTAIIKKADICKLQSTGYDEMAMDWEQYFCSKHSGTHDAVLTMLDAAGNGEEAQLKVWQYAIGLWQAELDAMYEELILGCDAGAKRTILSERIQFEIQAMNYGTAMNALYPTEPTLAAQKVAEMWEEKCTEMCYEIHTAPAERADKLTVELMREANLPAARECICSVTEEDAKNKIYTDHLCGVHGFTFSMTMALLKNGQNAEEWARIRSMWTMELNSSYNALYNAVDMNGEIIMVEKAMFGSYLEAHETYLKALYPDKPEIVEEVITTMIIERTLEMCELVK